MSKITDFVEFSDKKLEKRCLKGKVPMETFYEAYFAGDLDFKKDVTDFLAHRDEFVSNKLTAGHLKWAITNFVPEVAIHSKSQDQRIVREHYDRGNDFFGWFLGERMVYTSGFFQNPNESLEQAQDNKMDLVCQKLQLQPGETMLDIGCGWGTLVRHAAKHYGVTSMGVTLAKNQTEFANGRIAQDGLSDRAKVLCLDYRDIPQGTYNKISSLEMVEHVGVRKLQKFYDQVFEMLDDKGIFLLQWTGLRRAMKPEDLIWGLFMNRHVFPGADASLCAFAMVERMEKANFEIETVENLTYHYVLTIQRWHRNWQSNREAVIKAYGDRWYRIWNFFLAWSPIIGEQGRAACFQIVMNKNLDNYKRSRWIGNRFTLGERMPAPTKGRSQPQPQTTTVSG